MLNYQFTPPKLRDRIESLFKKAGGLEAAQEARLPSKRGSPLCLQQLLLRVGELLTTQVPGAYLLWSSLSTGPLYLLILLQPAEPLRNEGGNY